MPSPPPAQVARTSSHSNLFTPTFKVSERKCVHTQREPSLSCVQLSRRAEERGCRCLSCPPRCASLCLQAVLAKALERGVHGKEICSFIEEQQLDQ